MTHDDPLTRTVDATCTALEDRCRELVDCAPRDRHEHADLLVAAAGRHLGAVDQVLVPLVRHQVSRGDEVTAAYLGRARGVERALVRLEGRAYGEVHLIHLPWAQTCSDVQARLDAQAEAERDLVERLVDVLPRPGLAAVAEQLFHAEVKAPTRPHPYLPHTGWTGTVTRRVWAVADRFWDTTQARVVPSPVVPHPHRHHSLLAQYVCADPHFDRSATLVTHRRRGQVS